ncbi:Predicted anti-sigma-YlaC factor YlaD, contains Zn-finger domain [Micromonospora phaseoli]|uniref:Predicted anti-sigma-YlaC factor YlaD, contains Zn-finger domain n=1 Tax=Micromonospora phaseoli TaxID=1144548 RepID=A0A1H7ADB8_9ACTN|nr:zf-HC2 domain-containing protein [Micromonospora phaseoli]PZV96443.1 putative anti-sigma-YlaC factor YlaD [Micromonospora phaseoli]GIJ76131.1 membrane protein [Micromonospora phaseoli]SEJ63643.1 Predicted anti-sigma-YlaC factor YlaD, contains Zn-finger domain [Micromonospora phaseoli]
MGCEQWREILSAQLDGEATTTEQRTVGVHLETCVGCRAWLDSAARVTRRARTQVVTSLPDLTGAILAAAPPAPPRRRWRELVAAAGPGRRGAPHVGRAALVTGLRAALGLLGAVQLVLGLAQIGRAELGQHLHATGQHLWHESAAWNVAVGAGFLFVALRRTSPSGLLPMLSAFVITLVLLSVNDLVAAQVAVERLVSHGFLVVGYLITVLLSRSSRQPGDPSDRQRPEQSRWRLRLDEADEPAPLRLLPPYPAQARHGHDQRRAA